MTEFNYVEAAKALAQQLDAVDGVRAYHDPAKLANNVPCLFVGLPKLDHTEGSFTSPQVIWPIFALSSKDSFTLDALREIQPLIQAARDVLDVEREEPTRYPLGKSTVPAYVCTHTEIP